MKMTKNELKGIVRNEILKYNKDWKVKNKDITISDEAMNILAQTDLASIKSRIKRLLPIWVSTKGYYWRKMHYTAGPFEDNYDLSTEAFKRSDYYPKLYSVTIDEDTCFLPNDDCPFAEGPWGQARIVGWEGLDWRA